MSLDSSNNIPEIVSNSVNVSTNSWSIGADLIVILLAIAGALFGFFYLLKKYLIPLFESIKERKKTKILIFRLEVIIWLVFTLFALTQLFIENIWITAALVIIIAGVGFNFWRDFFPGLLLRVSLKFKEKDLVRFKEYSGSIARLGKTSLVLKTEDEELLYIPYRKITNDIFIKRQAKGRLMSSKIILQIGLKDPDVIVQKVAGWMIECPWAVSQSSNPISVQPGGLLHVTVYAVDNESIGKVERFLRAKLHALD